MELMLLRHGKPNIDSTAMIRSAEMQAWITEYNAAGITEKPDTATILNGCTYHFVVCSPLRRALESVDALGLKPNVVYDELCEAPLPVLNLPLLKLTPVTWTVLFRLFWLSGGTCGTESFSSVKKRAKRVACELELMATEHGRVLSVGHGFINMLIARELERSGWKREKTGSSGYWANIKLVRETMPV
ncbi:phosphoglycerate mutase [Salmonella enterica subsp. enterica serovar Virchow]|nr:phosphoglycerate mutase [Salmonella enterica subsp. enterica serovar Virchow]